jgi:mRNA-degrading endonuclease toxin of MazEF toxin-antitoxin module
MAMAVLPWPFSFWEGGKILWKRIRTAGGGGAWILRRDMERHKAKNNLQKNHLLDECKKERRNMRMCRNGDIYITRLDMQPEGSLQAGIRPVIVISNDMANKFSPVVTVIPVTSKVKKKKLPTHVHLNDCGLDGPCTAMAEQITSIDKDRLGKWIGSIKNTDYEGQIKSMEEAIRAENPDCDGFTAESADSVPMYVLTNIKKIEGAACMLYPGLIREFADRTGSSLFIIPSSVHELLILPVEDMKETEEIRSMIREINDTQVQPDEILSYSLYCYDREEGRIYIC